MKSFKQLRTEEVADLSSHSNRRLKSIIDNPNHPHHAAAKAEMDRRSMQQEKTLTPAEKKKREEIAQAMERDNPGMDKSKKMAIATATAKRVAESIEKMSSARLKYHATKKFPHGSFTDKEIKDEHKRRQKSEPNYHTVKPALESVQQVDEISQKKLTNYIGAASDSRKQKTAAAADKRTSGVNLALKKATGKAKVNATESVEQVDEAKPDAVEVMRRKQQMANISTSDKDKLAKIRAMLDKEKKK